MTASATPPKKRPRNDPEWIAAARRIREGSFVREGLFVAFPLCFPGVTDPIPLDESRIVALAADGEGLVYGATAGRAHHVFFASFHGTGGIVLDLRWPDPNAACPAIACGIEEVIFAANTAAGGRVLRRKLQGLPGDLLHEWSFPHHEFQTVPDAEFEKPVLDLLADGDRRFAIGTTADGLFRYDFAERRITARRALPAIGRLCFAFGTIWGLRADGALWHYDEADGARTVTRLSADFGDADASRWAADRSGRCAYWIASDGRIFSLAPDGALTERARLEITPATAATVAPDGRLFVFAGEGIAHFHIFDPATGAVRDLGAAVSVLERRRYGYAFATALAGRGGELYFGEDDSLGHLWLYFPAQPGPR